ncbi:J domain-containing protein [Haloplanus salilacus]|uniref:J domain-containing protein n=1 Tax=Haloplanus salilacus TaxID=2949994 RepID=UPI0030D1E08D
MDRDRLVLGLAAVFAGITVVLVVLAFVRQLFLLFLALPFGLTTYLMWHHATGRLAARTRRRARANGSTGSRRSPGGFGATAGGRGSRNRRAGRTTQGGRTGGASAPDDTPTRREAYETLGLEPGAGEDAVRRAYRSKVKDVHPDTEEGDEEAFKRVNRAYERLRG